MQSQPVAAEWAHEKVADPKPTQSSWTCQKEAMARSCGRLPNTDADTKFPLPDIALAGGGKKRIRADGKRLPQQETRRWNRANEAEYRRLSEDL
jgi:hypothetical protein